MNTIEVLKKDINSYEELKKNGKKCLTTNNEECCFVHYPEIKKALLALEKLDRLEKWLKEEYNKIEGKQTERELFILEIVEQLEKKGVVKA